ncbi:oxidoreductase [Aspergillus ustus]|uniref:Oxidoreductase n=1 Tax=Aspergillus ustus TaxID=40382 RepID=A0A0C1EG90_ASPUT|nr:oxidoreductase [Aspergillus ustus]
MSDPQFVLITGCTDGGIGAAFARSFYRRGFHVFGTARSIEKMSQLKSIERITLLPLDVTSSSSIQAAVEQITPITGGKLHYLVNNSGVSYVMPALDTDVDEARKMFDVNLLGVLAITQAFFPLVRESRGCIMNMGSITGVLNAPWGSLYAASKPALITMSETLRLELAPFGMRVVTIVTGAVESNIMSSRNQFALPNDSMYRAITDIDAEKVVSDVTTNGTNGTIWRGSMASTVRWLMMKMPAFIVDKVLLQGTGLGLLEERAAL